MEKGQMLETNWMLRGDGGLVDTQLGCGKDDFCLNLSENVLSQPFRKCSVL